MSVQEACETLEGLLERETRKTNGRLTMKEFNALNKLLLEAAVHLGYKVTEEYPPPKKFRDFYDRGHR